MENLQRSQAFLRKRKMMLVMPLLVIPFLTMGFWALGGGRNQQAVTKAPLQGLNLNLPDANLKDDGMADKLSFYDKADKDSAKRGEYRRSDPYYNFRKDTIGPSTDELESMTNHTATKYHQQLNPSPYEPSNNNAEQKLMQKLALLQQELNKPKDRTASEKMEDEKISHSDALSEQVNRLEGMMQGMGSTNSEDPEMQQLGKTLDKILDIQHPERVKGRLNEKLPEQKKAVYTVNKSSDEENISLLGFQDQTNKGFFSLGRNALDTAEGNTIEAEVFTSQTIINGSVVRLRLLAPVYINGKLVPKGTYANGLATLNNERLEVDINSIRAGNSLLSVRLAVYDLDGLPGLYIPGAISREVAKQSVDNSLQLLELYTMDPSLKAQAAATGINAAKNLLSRKAKQVKVFIKAGYKVLLKNAAQ